MKDLIENLSSFNEDVRNESSRELAALCRDGKIAKYQPLQPFMNMHLHTFHSYNYKSWSPCRVVFEGWRSGLQYLGTVDFDTIEGLEETLEAGRQLHMNVTGGFESRVFVKEFSDEVINSPNEPGIYYFCGKNFKKRPGPGTEEEKFFDYLKDTAQRRNRDVITKINDFLKHIEIDYDSDVVPLTPSANPTERHIIEAYSRKSCNMFGQEVAGYWSQALGIAQETLAPMISDKPAEFQELLRSRLIKKGSPGYVPARQENFPGLDHVVEMVEKAGGVPVATWLDGTNPGESDPGRLIEFFKTKNIKIVTIIPERNYNIADRESREEKICNLRNFMTACQKLDMPVICGTEMNKAGQPFIDDFRHPVLEEYLEYFMSSAERFFDGRLG